MTVHKVLKKLKFNSKNNFLLLNRLDRDKQKSDFFQSFFISLLNDPLRGNEYFENHEMFYQRKKVIKHLANGSTKSRIKTINRKLNNAINLWLKDLEGAFSSKSKKEIEDAVKLDFYNDFENHQLLENYKALVLKLEIESFKVFYENIEHPESWYNFLEERVEFNNKTFFCSPSQTFIQLKSDLVKDAEILHEKLESDKENNFFFLYKYPELIKSTSLKMKVLIQGICLELIDKKL